MGFEISWEPKGVVKRLFGHVTNDDLQKASAIVQGNARFDDLRYVIIDFLDCTSHSVSDPALLEVAAIDQAALEGKARHTTRKIRIAILATDSKILDLAKHYADYDLTTVTFGIFFNRSDARVWLD
jgi:hypothetical protein